MGSTYQTALAVGELADIQEVLDRMGIEALTEEAIGGNADLFAPLGVDGIDLDALGHSLVDTKQFAESQHAAILRALNLRPDPLTEAYRHQASRIRN